MAFRNVLWFNYNVVQDSDSQNGLYCLTRAIPAIPSAALMAAALCLSTAYVNAQSVLVPNTPTPVISATGAPVSPLAPSSLPAITIGTGNTKILAFTTPRAITGYAAPTGLNSPSYSLQPISPGSQFLSGAGPQGIGGGGIHATFGSSESLVLGITGATALSTSIVGGTPVSGPAVTVYGADLSGKLHVFRTDRLLIESGIQVSPVGRDSSLAGAIAAGNNQSYRALVGYDFGSWSLKGGYQATDPYFASPLVLDGLGSWQDPNNVQGPVIDAHYQPTKSITLAARGNFLQGQNDVGSLSPVGRNDSISHVDFQAHYGLTRSSSLDLGYEWVQWDLKNDQGLLAAAGKPVEQYITIGVGHNFGPSTALKMLYRIGNYSDDGTHMSPTGQDLHDDEAIGQLSVKF